MSTELVAILATTLFGSAGLVTVLTGAAPLTRPARLRHRIEKDAPLAKTFPEGSESRRALEWSCVDAAHQLAATQLYPVPYRYRYFPLAYGLAGVLTAGMGILVARQEPTQVELVSPTGGLVLMSSAAVVYVALAFRLHRKTVGRWRLYGLLSVESRLAEGSEPSSWEPRKYRHWQDETTAMVKAFNTRANRTPKGDPTATMASTEEGEAP